MRSGLEQHKLITLPGDDLCKSWSLTAGLKQNAGFSAGLMFGVFAWTAFLGEKFIS